MLISIIIPIYNVEKYIERCLFSVFNQTYKEIEIILVNDCSPDSSMEIVERILKENPIETRVKVINHDENKGLSDARNTGIINAQGEYIYFLDSDDAITLDCIQTLVNNSNGEEVIIASVLKDDKTLYWENQNIGGYKGNEVFDAYFNGDIYDMACNKLVKKDFLINNQLFFKPKLIHEDFLWSYQVAMATSSMIIIKEPTYIYFVRSGSLNTNFTKRNVDNIFISFRIIQEDIKKNKYYNLNSVVCFLVCKSYDFKYLAVKDAKMTLKEYLEIDFNLIDLSMIGQKKATVLKYSILKMPGFIQFYIFKIRKKLQMSVNL
ncbi:glycosyltransferase involved in cell wall biosynthesis [Flavobacterium cutihirudinis]|uniref:Glycosyltransferase involved in cell wall biosynthesis n=1 Tax=Flavobacterium cutihirudinis TaxID=1265740 RepID=A0A3D9FK98_9FLAO|nr:glycosyltransferase family 2 protein [Flavobacterium cutihirudinis]RED19604.1 glycosyltransferase involved in cell wall biosynthesis [Flavobacterium cutihirudinis]